MELTSGEAALAEANLFLLTNLNPPRSKIAPSIARITARVTIAPMTPATAFEIPDPEPEDFEEPLLDEEPSSPLRYAEEQTPVELPQAVHQDC